jgi:hypothetical protein
MDSVSSNLLTFFTLSYAFSGPKIWHTAPKNIIEVKNAMEMVEVMRSANF